jgi:hypothetical protein
VRLFQIFLLFAPILTVFGNNTVFAENRGGKSSKSSENIKQSMFAGLHIDRRSADIALKIPDNFPLGIVSTIPLDDFAFLKTVTVEIHIAEPHIGDLLVQLECLNGQIVTLQFLTSG